MKISNYETALKLSKITGRPLEDFYDGIIPSENEQDKEEEMEGEEEALECSTSDDISETEYNQGDGLALRGVLDPVQVKISERKDVVQNEQTTLYTIKYGGRLSENGVVIGHTKDMTNAEYKSLTKKMTQNELLKSPLLHVFFRAEEQNEGHFWHWLDKFPKENNENL
ncbi:hypothetical protein UFOVP53_7 [uncultured Caudovirales phage]|uniref:Uncharacterized protein n=1 Tax=uncultured Caudovirales phage TaxID=2100421 RepID=A0A6J5KWA1_9CAUD|nr:hypothetical protein UFOVP53_7 [uncultured Caudovirales phage]